jgi:diguanylate cyclase
MANAAMDNKDWKAKYFDGLEQLEENLARWTELEDLLRKAISRLALTATGTHKKLDRLLNNIRQHSRNKDNDALEADLQKLATLLTQIDDETNKEKNTLVQDHILSLIGQLQLDKQFQQQLSEFKQSISTLSSEECISRFATLMNEFLDFEPSDKTSIKEVFLTLIDKIAFTHGGSDQLSAIKEDLDHTFNIDSWHSYLDQIIGEVRIIIQTINDEKVEFESLIVDVTRQLNEISSVLTDEYSDNLQGRKETQHLQSLMDQNVKNIQSSVEQAQDLDGLKVSINARLESIRQGVNDFVVNDTHRFKKSEDRNTALQKQIKLMEDESEQLKLKLTENRQQLMFDTLTGARSRLSYDEILDQEITRWTRYQEIFSYALLDIDHFKNINDQFGHHAGDKALQIVANLMSRHIRKSDFLFRVGGEEFVLLLPKTSLAAATPLVEKIRSSVGQTSFHFKRKKVEIRLSGGITTILKNDNAESIYERADSALYEAKNGGRDQLVEKVA